MELDAVCKMCLSEGAAHAIRSHVHAMAAVNPGLLKQQLDFMEGEDEGVMEWAVRRRENNLLELMIMHGADPNKKNPCGQILFEITPIFNNKQAACIIARHTVITDPRMLLIAVDNGYIEAAITMINKGICVNISSNQGVTPLHYAGLFGMTDVVDLLIKAGAHVNAVDNWGMTPLMYATRSLNKEVILMLARANADVFVVDKKNKTALNHAMVFKQSDVVVIIENMEKQQRTLFDVASNSKRRRIL